MLSNSNKIQIFHCSIFLIFVIIYCFFNFFNIQNYFDDDFIINNFFLSKNSLEHPVSFILSAFSHFSFIHILMNSIFLYQFNSLIKNHFSFKTLIKLFIFSLVLSSFFSYLYLIFANNDAKVLGASGFLFGYLGYIFYFFDRKEKIHQAIFLILFHLICFYLDIPIAWFAHLFGFISGLFFSYYSSNTKYKNFKNNKSFN